MAKPRIKGYWLVRRIKLGTGKARLILAESKTLQRIQRDQQLYGCGQIVRIA